MRRGQLQTLEPIIIVIMLILVIGVGLLFYVRINDTQQKQDRGAMQQQEDLVMLSRISRMPELSCSNDASLTNCIDIHKAQSFAAVLKDPQSRLYYYPFLGDANISITWLDLETGVVTTLPLYSNMNDESYSATMTYFTVYESVTGTTRLATLSILRGSG